MSDIKALLKDARKFIDDKNFDEAQECCKAILRKDKENYIALVLLGKSLQDSDQAPLAFQKAIACKPSQLLAWQGLANYFERKEDVSAKTKLFPIYEEMLKLQTEDTKIIEILVKLTDLGCILKSSESITSIIKFINGQQENRIKDVAEKHLLQLLESNVHCKFDDIPVIIDILNNRNTNYPSDALMIVICKVILQKSDIVSAIKEILELDFFSKNLEVKKWLCQYLCEFFVSNNTFDRLDIEKHIDIIAVGIESSKHLGLLKSMICFARGSYLDAYKQCIPLIKYQRIDKIEVIYIIKCTIMLKKWSATQELAINFLTKVTDSDLKTSLHKILLQSYLEQHKWSEAISIAKEIPIDNLNTDELAALAKCYIEENESAEHVLEKLDSDQLMQIQALALMKKEKYEEAISVLQNCKEDFLKYFYLGKAYWHIKDYDNCLVNLIKSAKANCDHADTFYFLALFYHKYRNDLQKAKKCYEKAYSLCNFEGLYVKSLGEIYIKLDLEHQCFELLKNALGVINNKGTWLNLRLGLHYLKKWEWENAIINFRDVVKLIPNDVIALECLADAYYGRGSYTSALRVYNKVMTLNPKKSNYCHSLTNIACIYGLLTQYDDSMSTFQKVFDVDPYYLVALKGIAETLIKIARKKFSAKLYGAARDDAQAAIEYLSKAIWKEKKVMLFWELLADALLLITRLPNQYSYAFLKKSFNDCNDTLIKKEKLDIYPQAIACFSYVTKYRQEISSFNLAFTYLEYYVATKQISYCNMAFNLTKACIKERPNCWRNWNLMGEISVFLKRYDIAQHCFIKALNVTHKWSNAKVWCNLGMLYLRLDLYKLSNYCFWRGQSTLPSYPQSWIGQGLIAEVIRKEEAMDLFRHACRLGYDQTSAFHYAYWVCRTLKNVNWRNDSESRYAIEGLHAITFAIDLLEWYLTYEPNDPCACNILGILQERKGLLGPALKSYQKAYSHVEDDKQNIVLLNMARVLLRLEQYDEAIQYYKAIGEASLDSSCGLALALYKTGQYEDSYSVYDMSLQWLCNDDQDKADILVAMAGIVYKLKGKDDAKTLLFHSIQASQKKPTPYSLFSLCSLGVINSDRSLSMSALNELRKYEKDTNFAYDIGFLKAYVVGNEDIELAIQTMCETLHSHPGNSPLWFCMSQFCLRATKIMASIASCCAQRAIYAATHDERKSSDIGKMFATASIAEYIAGDHSKPLKFVKKGLHINPCQSELWAILCFSLASNKKWFKRKDWLLGALTYMKKSLDMSHPLSRWVTLLEKELSK